MPDTDKQTKKSWFKRVFGGKSKAKTSTPPDQDLAKQQYLNDYNAISEEITRLLARQKVSIQVRKAQSVLDTVHQRAVTLAAKSQYPELLSKYLKPMVTALSQLREAVVIHDDAEKSFTRLHGAVSFEAKEVLAYPQNTAPQWLKDAQAKLKKLDEALRECIEPKKADSKEAYDFELATTRAQAVRAVLDPVLPRKREHEKALREYGNAVKPIIPLVKYLDNVAVEDGWAQEHAKAQSLRNQVAQAQTALDYVEALKLLPQLREATQKVVDKRLLSLKTSIDGADSADKVGDVVKKLQGTEITALGVDDQVRLLKTLRETATKDINAKDAPELYRARCKLYDNMKLQQEFVETDVKNRDDVVQQLRKDPKVKEAVKSWATWSTEDRLDFLNHVASQQCGVMGQPAPKIEPFNKPRSSSGSVSYGACDLGLLDGKSQSTITINTHPDAKFDDIEEQINTILHENAHNYQLDLVARYRQDRTGLSKLNTQEQTLLPQIMMWDENAQGYVPDGPTYNNQPLEVHAWSFGNEGAAGVLGPEPTT
jgi:hypothetical protein